MKLVFMFGLLSIVALLILSQSLLSVKAENELIEDFGQTDYYTSDSSSHNIFASINVKASIETEPNGHWIVNKTYQVSLLLSITYVNESIYNPNGFTIECYRSDYPTSFEDAKLTPSTNNVTVTPQNNGTMTMAFKPLIVKETGLYFNFALKVYYDNNLETSGSWTQGLKNLPPIPIIVDDRFPTPTTPEFTPIAIVIGLAGVAVSTIFIVRKQKHA